MIGGTSVGPIATWIGAIAGVTGVSIAWTQLRRGRREVRRGVAPVLIVEFNPAASTSAFVPSSHTNAPVVQKANLLVRNDGNGPAMNLAFQAKQGGLELERGIDPSSVSRGVSRYDVYRTSLARGEQLECFFSVRAGFMPPKEGAPLVVIITCEDIWGGRFKFIFQASMDLLSALSEGNRRLTFVRMEES